MSKKQRTLAIILGALFVVMLVCYFVIIVPLTATEDGSDGDSSSDREMMYVHTERANIKSIEVKNSYGTYAFVRDKNDKFVIKGCEGASYDATLFSTLVTDCGYTLSKATVENDNAENLAEYGLDEASDPAYYILTTKEDEQYKVWIGDMIPSNGGYYARADGENKVYVLDPTLKSTVLSPIEAFVTPTLIYPTSLNTYFMIDEFSIYHGAYMGEEEDSEGEQGVDTSATDGTAADNGTGTSSEKIKPYVSFHYVEEADKTIYSSASSFHMDEPGDGIYIPSGYLDSTLQLFIGYAGSETVKLAPVDADLEKYGLIDAEYSILLVNNATTTNKNGETEYVPVVNLVYYSDMQTDEETGVDFRYAYSVLFGIIAKVPYYDCAFLEYDLNTWTSNTLFSVNIDNVSSIQVEGKDTDITFTLRGDGEALVVTDSNSHTPEVKNFRKFYQVILGMSKGGYVTLTEDQCKALESDEKNVTAKLTISFEDGNAYVYRFYSYGVQTYYTINGEGEFYLPTAQVNKLIADAQRITKDEVVNPDNAY